MSAISEELVMSDPSSTVGRRIVQRGMASRREPQQSWALIWGGLVLCCLPFLVPYFASLWRQDLYQYFPFLLLAVGYLTHARFDGVLRGPSRKLGWATLTLAVVALATAALLHSSWLGGVAFIIIAATLLASLRGVESESLAYLALPLVMLIRISERHANSIVGRLQGVTSQLVGLLLDLLGIPHITLGNIIELPSKELFVAEACSGIQSAFTMCFLALLVVAWMRRPWIVVPVYLAVALLLAVVANVLRVAAVAIAEAWYSLDLTSGWGHDAIGYAALLFAVGALLSFDQLSAMLLHPVDLPEDWLGPNPLALAWNRLLGVQTLGHASAGDTRSDDAPRAMGGGGQRSASSVPTQSNPPSELAASSGDREAEQGIRTATGFRSYLPLALLGTAGLAAVVMLGGTAAGRSVPRPNHGEKALLFNPSEDFLGDRVGVLSIGSRQVFRNGNDPRLGVHADLWQCRVAGESGLVVISQPYDSWHDLCWCYEAIGWELVDRGLRPVENGKPLAFGKFKNESGQIGYLFFTALYSNGSIPAPPPRSFLEKLLGPFGPLVTDGYDEVPGVHETLMLQMWTVREEELSPDEVQQIANSVATIRTKTSQALKGSG